MTDLRTLVITVTLPYPPRSGRDLRNWQNSCGLNSSTRTGVFSLSPSRPACNATPPAKFEFWRYSTGVAHVFDGSAQIVPARAWPLEPMGHPADGYYSGTVAREIEKILLGFKPHVTVIEGLSLYRYIDTVKQFDSRIIFDCHNVEAMLYQELAANASGNHLPARLMRDLLPARTRLIEEKAVQSADQLWVCSDEDAASMTRLYRTSTPVQVIPNGVEVDSYREARSARREASHNEGSRSKTLIFPAAFKWEPNTVGASFLINEIFPRLSAIFPECRLLLAGREPTAEMINAARQDPRIVVTGEVPQMQPYLARAAAMVVPLFQGGGTRLKILEAFAAGVPVISTAKGAEGLTVEDGKHLLIAETGDEFVSAVDRLWTDKPLASRLAANGLRLVTESYSAPVIARKIAKAVQQLCLSNPTSKGAPRPPTLAASRK